MCMNIYIQGLYREYIPSFPTKNQQIFLLQYGLPRPCMFTHLKLALMLNPVQGSEPCPRVLKGMLDFVVVSDLHQGVLRFTSFVH